MKVALWLLAASAMIPIGNVAAVERPNFVVIFCDDLGYGDLGCFGNPVIKTPHLDGMAAQGQKWTQFYAAAPVCTPSRAGLMTGRLPIRNGMTSADRVVLFPDSAGGLPPAEATIAEVLQQAGYVSGCFGKWHLGHLPEFLPGAQGFATYYGIPYSNDMDFVPGSPNYRKNSAQDANYLAASSSFNVPLMKDELIVERPADQTTITRRYTEAAVEFIRQNRNRPFFVYLPHSMPHIPLFASEGFRSKSRRGLYGDVVQEIDWSVGQVLETLEELELDQKTLVVFSSDNGPWLSFQTHGGSAGPLRAGKGTTFEGGMRVPTLFQWPGRIPGGSVVTGIGSTLDLMATFARLAGATPPDDRQLDSLDLSPALLGTGPSPRDAMYYWTRGELHAARIGPWKLHLKLREPVHYGRSTALEKPLLYHLEHDLGEQFDLADRRPDVVERIQNAIRDHVDSIEPAPDNLTTRLSDADQDVANEAPPLAKLLDQTRTKHNVCAMGALVIADGQPTEVQVSGIVGRGSKTPVPIDARWHIGSCTKSMTATLAAALHQHGKLDWKLTVGEAFADEAFAVHTDYELVTLVELLSHRAGVPNDLISSPLWARMWADANASAFDQRKQIAAEYLTRPPLHPPGEQFAYSNVGYVIAGRMIEKQTDKTYETLLAEYVFNPLDIKSAGFGPPPDDNDPRGHRFGFALPPNHLADNPPGLSSAGRVHLSLADWGKYAAEHLRAARGEPTELLTPESATWLHRAYAPKQYALGWGRPKHDWLDGRPLAHAGSNTMWYAEIWIVPEQNTAWLISANEGTPAARKACGEVIRSLARQYAPPR